MVELYDKQVALGYAGKYFDELAKSGYVKKGVTTRYEIYMFIVDFIESLYDYLTEEDYITINNAMLNLFGYDSCLLPYPVFCSRAAKVGLPRYMGGSAMRKHLAIYTPLKKTENEHLREK